MSRAWALGLAGTVAVAFSTGCPPPHRPAPHPDDVRVVPGAIDAKKLLAAVAEGAREAGAGELTAVGARIVTDGEQLGSFVEVPASDCVLVIARGGKSVNDIDLFVYTDGGDRLASDEAPDSRAAVMVCPPHPRRVYVVARSVSGEGMVALGVMRVAADKADAVAKAVEVRGRPGEDTGKLATWPGLERAIRERRLALGSKWEDLRRLAVPLSPRAYTSVTADVEAERCLDVLVVPSDEIQGMDVVVVDDHGRTVARGKPPGKERGFVLCAREPRVVTIMIRPRVSSGLAAVILGRSERGAMGDLTEKTWVAADAPVAPLDVARASHEARVAKLRLEPMEQLAGGDVVVGATTSGAVELSAGCTRLDVLGGAPLGGFAAELWGGAGERLAEMHGGAHATTFSCGGPRKARIEISAKDRSGPFVLESRRDPAPPAVLVQHPLAASRLLHRLDAAIGPVDVQHAAPTRVVRVGPNAARETIRLGEGKCAEVIAAVGDGPSGLSMTIEIAGVTTSPSRGKVATGQRICAEVPEEAAVHLSVGTGEGDALLLVHELL